ncbi:Tat pathway signal protein [Alishewanella sp. WH16-1]|uniref:PhoX family protein n=1 Tax=Alishewanella sp. WH16-1 TaxID=1651088 RepID=UPI00070DB9ED|nr:PhoX family phosphatase [Alishewanella sp. WH16-1]KRS21282.1 Tat pathway signal protein [Alishewanella sp. WH16-1]
MSAQQPRQPQIDNSGDEPVANFSANPCFAAVLQQRLQRRTFLKGSLALAISGVLGSQLSGCRLTSELTPTAAGPIRPGFLAVAGNRLDQVTVPAGYRVQPFLAWGTPICGDYPAYKADASNTAAEQAQQMGMHHDGMHFFPIDLPQGGNSSSEGLLVMNHEYVEPDLLHPAGPVFPRTAEQVAKEQAAHGVSVVHIIRQEDGQWMQVAGSRYNRRITVQTPAQLAGPVRGHAKVRSRYSPDGTACRGTLNNCSHGVTPWGTYLTCEENWAGYFVNHDAALPREQARYSVPRQQSGYHWETAQPASEQSVRFNASQTAASATQDYRHEPNTFGWIVEIDPFNPQSVPVKRTALGRFAHEGLIFAKAVPGQPLVAYSGDDSRFEYIYKFVSAAPYDPATASGALLDNGTLYAARFNEDGSGEWLALDLTDPVFRAKVAAAGVRFDSQADVLLNTRLAADIAGATKMDRPEWGAVHPQSGEVYFTLTNNSRRQAAETDAANPRPENLFGHIIRWREQPQAQKFEWDIFLLAGPTGTATPGTALQLTADNALACPDGLWFDPQGLLWIQTDMSGSLQSEGPFGNNQMLAADTAGRELKRFLVGPVECEVTGVVTTPDGKTMFVNIQHPGDRSTPTAFTSHWPDGGNSRPRSATVVITKEDGGVIGS